MLDSVAKRGDELDHVTALPVYEDGSVSEIRQRTFMDRLLGRQKRGSLV